MRHLILVLFDKWNKATSNISRFLISDPLPSSGDIWGNSQGVLGTYPGKEVLGRTIDEDLCYSGSVQSWNVSSTLHSQIFVESKQVEKVLVACIGRGQCSGLAAKQTSRAIID